MEPQTERRWECYCVGDVGQEDKEQSAGLLAVGLIVRPALAVNISSGE